MPLVVDDGWVLSSSPWGPSRLSIARQEAATASAVPVLHVDAELRYEGQGLPFWLFFFCPITYNHVSSLSS